MPSNPDCPTLRNQQQSGLCRDNPDVGSHSYMHLGGIILAATDCDIDSNSVAWSAELRPPSVQTTFRRPPTYEQGRFCAVSQLQLVQQLGHVMFDRPLGQVE